MKRLKKSSNRKARQTTHNREGARVIQDVPAQPKGKGSRTKACVALVTQVAKKLPYYIWLWEKFIDGLQFLKEEVAPWFEHLL